MLCAKSRERHPLSSQMFSITLASFFFFLFFSLSRATLRHAQTRGYMVNNFPLEGVLAEGGGLLSLCCYVWMHQLLIVALSKIHFYRGGHRRCQRVHLELWGKGDLAHCASEKSAAVLPYSAAGALHCFVPPLYPRMHGLNLWGLDPSNENYIHTRATPAYTAYIMQQMSIGARVSKFDSIS